MVVLAVALPMALLTAGVIWRLDRQARDTQRQSLDYAARSISGALDAHFARHIALGRFLAMSPALLADDLTAFRQEAERAFPDVSETWVVVADKEGRQILNLRSPPGQPLPLRHPEAIRTQERAFAKRDIEVSNVLIGPFVKTWVAIIDIPIFYGGEPYRVLAIAMNAQRFLRLLNSTYLPQGWRAAIVDANGHFVARTGDPEARSTGSAVSSSWRETLGKDGVFEYFSQDGDVILNANARSTLSGWTAVVAATKQTFTASVWQTIYGAIVVGLVVTVFSILVAFWIASRIGRPVRELERKAVALVRGEKADIQSSVPEITRAWRALSRAVSEREQANAALSESERRLSLALSAAAIGVQDVDLRTGRYVWDQRTRELCGAPDDLEITDDVFAASLHPEDRALVRDTLARASDPSGDGRYSGEFRVLNFRDGQERWLAAQGQITFADGRPKRLVGTIMDITLRKKHEEHVEFVMHELSHRSKNLLSVVQSIARQTARQTKTFAAFEDRFMARITALMAAHDLLVKNDWAGAPLQDVVFSQLAPFEGGRIEMGGETFVIRPEAVQNITLALHELATNAVKYGALSAPNGRLEVKWALTEVDDVPHLRLTWHERGGPTSAASPRKGFGTVVLERVVPQALNATAKLDLSSGAVSWTIDLPTIWIVAPAERVSIQAA